MAKAKHEVMVDEDTGQPTVWHKIMAFTVPMAPGVEMPVALNPNLEYRFTYDHDLGKWIIQSRPGVGVPVDPGSDDDDDD